MVDQELTKYILDCLHAKLTRSQITAALVSSGWEKSDIEKAFTELGLGAAAGEAAAPVQLAPAAAAQSTVTTPTSTITVTNTELSHSGAAAVKPGTAGKLPGFFKLLGLAFHRFGRNLAHMLVLLGLFLLVTAVLDGGAFALYAYKVVPAAASAGLFIVAYILTIVTVLWISVTLMYVLKDPAPTVGAAIRQGLKRTHSYVWIALLTSLLIFAGNFAVVFGIMFSVWFSFAPLVMVQDDDRGMSALLKSKEYVRGFWWGTLFRSIGIAIIFLILYAAGLALVVLKPIPDAVVIGCVLEGVILLLFVPLALAFHYEIFSSLRTIKGEISVPKKGRALFTVLALLGFVIPVVLIAAAVVGYGSKIGSFISQHRVNSSQPAYSATYSATATIPPIQTTATNPAATAPQTISWYDGSIAIQTPTAGSIYHVGDSMPVTWSDSTADNATTIAVDIRLYISQTGSCPAASAPAGKSLQVCGVADTSPFFSSAAYTAPSGSHTNHWIVVQPASSGASYNIVISINGTPAAESGSFTILPAAQ